MGTVQLFGAVLLYHAQRLFLIGPADQSGMANVRHDAIDLMGDCLTLPNLRNIQNGPLDIKEINRLTVCVDIGITDPPADIYISILCNIAHVAGTGPDIPEHFMYLCAGGEYVAPVAEEKYNRWLADNGNLRGLHKGYGMCECGGTVTYSCERINTVGAAGIPMPHVTVAAFDLVTGEEKRYGERGEIHVLTPCRMRGYYKKPVETAKYFHSDAHGNVWACTKR